jgi:hypothetical protein
MHSPAKASQAQISQAKVNNLVMALAWLEVLESQSQAVRLWLWALIFQPS